MEEGGLAAAGGDFGGGMDAGAYLGGSDIGGLDAGGFDSALDAAKNEAGGGLDTGGFGTGGSDAGGASSPTSFDAGLSTPTLTIPTFAEPGFGLTTPDLGLSGGFGPAPGSPDSGIGTIGSDPFSSAPAFDLSTPSLGLTTPTVDPIATPDSNALGVGTIGTPIGGDPFAAAPALDLADPATDPLTGAVQTGAEALTGYRAGMYGEVGAEPSTADGADIGTPEELPPIEVAADNQQIGAPEQLPPIEIAAGGGRLASGGNGADSGNYWVTSANYLFTDGTNGGSLDEMTASTVAARGDSTPIALTTKDGTPVRNINGDPVYYPAALPPAFYASKGDFQSSISRLAPNVGLVNLARDLYAFRQGGNYDAQRINDIFHPEFVDYATIAIGIYAAKSGMLESEILGIENAYASMNSHYPPGTVFDATYTSLPARNVFNTDLGYRLVNSGQLPN